MKIEVDISEQSVYRMKELSSLGLYGRDLSEVAARLIDKGLIELGDKEHARFLIQTRAKVK